MAILAKMTHTICTFGISGCAWRLKNDCNQKVLLNAENKIPNPVKSSGEMLQKFEISQCKKFEN